MSQGGLVLPIDLHFLGVEGVLQRMQSPDFKGLTVCDGFPIEDFDFSPLSCHEKLESLVLTSVSLEHIDRLLRHIRRLSALHVRSCQITDSAIKSISSIDGLERLSIWYPMGGVTGVNWQPLGNCESLTKLRIEASWLRRIDLTFASRLSRLTSLALDKNRLRTVDLEPLSHCAGLTELNLNANGLRLGLTLEPLSHCHRLRDLDITGNRLREIDLSPLASCDIVLLGVGLGRVRNIDLSPLASCRNLELISVGGQPITSLDLSPLSNCRRLTRVDVREDRLSEIDLSALGECDRLQNLNLARNRLRSVDLSPLEGCPALEELYLDGNRLATVDLSPLRYCPSLKKLDLRDNRLATVDLSPLWACPDIRLVDLRGNPLGEVDTSPAREASVRLAYDSYRVDFSKAIYIDTTRPESGTPDAADTVLTDDDGEDE